MLFTVTYSYKVFNDLLNGKQCDEQKMPMDDIHQVLLFDNLEALLHVVWSCRKMLSK